MKINYKIDPLTIIFCFLLSLGILQSIFYIYFFQFLAEYFSILWLNDFGMYLALIGGLIIIYLMILMPNIFSKRKKCICSLWMYSSCDKKSIEKFYVHIKKTVEKIKIFLKIYKFHDMLFLLSAF